MKLFIKGKGSVEINKSEYRASGGFGSVYIKGSTAYKIYSDAKHMIPEAKIQELGSLTATNIIKPESVLLDTKNHPVGYTMRAVPDSYALCQLFPKPFRARNNLTSEKVLGLVRAMQSTISEIHSKNVLIVDLNEFNFLVDKGFKETYFIDVDSYQTLSFPADSLMESVRDRHANKFTKETDWFSFAIVSYQMFRGIHPYKGKHAKYTTLDERMIHNLSVHNKDVGYPAGAVLPLDVIPSAYQDWYKAVLDDGKRLPPPTGLINTIVVVTPQVKTLVGHFFEVIEDNILSRKSILGHPLWLYRSANTLVALTTEKVYVERSREFEASPGTVVGFSLRQNVPVSASLKDKKIIAQRLDTGELFHSEIEAETLSCYDGRIYYKNGSNVLQLNLVDTAGDIRLTSTVVSNVMEKATQLFQGCSIQNLLGSYFVNIYPKDRLSYQFALKELGAKGTQVVDAKYDGRVLMVVCAANGKYDRCVFTFKENFSSYETRAIKDVSYTELNFVTLANGVCVCVAEDGSIELFSVNDSQTIKSIKDDIVDGVHLLKDGVRVMFGRNGRFFQLKSK